VPASVSRSERVALALDPGAVGLDQRREGADQARAVEAGVLAHLGDLDADLVGPVLVADAADLVARDLGGPQLADLVVLVGAGDVDAGVVADGPLEAVAEGQGEDALVVVVAVLAAAVRAGEEAVRVAEREADLKDEVEVAVAVERRALVDEEQAEHARAGGQAVDVGVADLAADPQAGRLGPAKPVRAAEDPRIEGDLERAGRAGNPPPADPGLLLVVLGDVLHDIFGVGELDLDMVDGGPGRGRREEHREAHRGREAMRPLGLDLLLAGVLGLAVAAGREVADGVGVIRVRRAVELRGEEARQVPA
jgi:hypothetical protein